MDTISSTLNMTRSIYSIISAIKNGPHHVRRAAESLHQFAAQLEHIHHIYSSDSDGVSLEHAGLLSSVRSSVSDLKDFSSKLQKIQLVHGENVTIKTWKRLRTAVTEKDLDNIATTIAHHRTQISLHLDIINSKSFASLKAQGAESSAALGRLEQASASQSQTTSSMQQELYSRLSSYEAILKDMAAMSNNQANAMQDMLSQFKQQVQKGSASQFSDASGILGEVNEQESTSIGNDSSATQEAVIGPDAQLLKSIERLSRLVHEKERTFDDDDVECDAIIQSLGNILDKAKKHTMNIAQGTLTRAIAQFTKRHGSHGVILNSQDQAVSRRLKRNLGDLMFHEIPLATGSMMFKRRRTTSVKPSETASTGEDTQKECVTTVTFMPNYAQNPYMIVASEYFSQYSSRQHVSSISYLAINPVLPTESRVFQVVERGDLQQLREMLQNGEASLRDTDVNGCSLLHFATVQPSMTRYLLENGLDVDHIGLSFGEFPETALQWLGADDEESETDVNRANECRELLLDAGSDPLAEFGKPGETGNFLERLAWGSMNGGCARFARRAVSQGLISIEDVITHERPINGDNLLHETCSNAHSGSTAWNVAATLNLGFNINATNWDGETALHTFARRLGYFLSPSTAVREQSVLVFLLQNGADPHRVPAGQPPIPCSLYNNHRNMFCKCNSTEGHGSYCGDIWDSAVSICGGDIYEHRKGHQRRPEYTAGYTREMFELLWEGRESECPYWDDEPWPKWSEDFDDEPLHLRDMDGGHSPPSDENSEDLNEGYTADMEYWSDEEYPSGEENPVDEEDITEVGQAIPLSQL